MTMYCLQMSHHFLDCDENEESNTPIGDVASATSSHAVIYRGERYWLCDLTKSCKVKNKWVTMRSSFFLSTHQSDHPKTP